MKFMRDKQGRLYAVDNGVVIGQIMSFGDQNTREEEKNESRRSRNQGRQHGRGKGRV